MYLVIALYVFAGAILTWILRPAGRERLAMA